MPNDNFVFAVKEWANENNPELGTIRPKLWGEAKNHSTIFQDEFPNNGTIFVTAGYHEIENRFCEEELFKCSFEVNQRAGDTSNWNYCQYITRSTDVKGLDKHELCHLITHKFSTSQRTITIGFKPTRYIFVQSGNDLYGPFDSSILNTSEENVGVVYTIKLIPINFPNRLLEIDCNDSDYTLFFRETKPLSISVSKEQRVLIGNIKDLLRSNNYELVDFMPDEKLLNWGNKVANEEHTISRSERKRFRDIVDMLGEVNVDFLEARKKRLSEIFDQTEIWESKRSTILSEFLRSEPGKKYIDEYLEANSEIVIKEEREKIEAELLKQTKKLREEIDELNRNIQEKKEAITKSEEKLEALKVEAAKVVKQDLGADVAELREKLSSEEAKYNALLEKLNLTSNIDRLRKEQTYLEFDIERKKEEKTRIEDAIKSVREELNKEQSEHQREIRKLKPYVDLLNGILPEERQSQDNETTKLRFRAKHPQSLEELVDEVKKHLASFGRSYTKFDIANFLITIKQHFLTVFAGYPGTGKTSLVHLLANALGITSEDRFLSISVARGWTSIRDLVGFYNPLNQKFQSSPTGLFQTLYSCDQEVRNEIFETYWTLLDEANLSPIEHYWSSFLAMCDNHTQKKIKTGDLQSQELLIPDSFKFFATVNYDSTTEVLSPRMIDRVPIILLQSTSPSLDLEAPNDTEPLISDSGLIPYSHYKSLFVDQEEDSLTSDEKRIIDDVFTTMQSNNEPNKFGLPIHISYRKKNDIFRYCRTARGFMKDLYELRAIDLAVAQYVLPLLNGNGEKYRNRLDELYSKLTPLNYSRAILKSIIERGENEFHFYRFFS